MNKIKKPHLNIGTIGHVGHGKTTLTSAITKVLAKKDLAKFVRCYEIDSLAEEMDGSVCVKAVEYETEKRHYTHFDCPGDRAYNKNAIRGISQMDAAILVIDATSGPMSQTRQHLLFARQMQIPKLVVFLNKCDLIEDDELLELITLEIEDLLTEYGFDGEDTSILRGSAYEALMGNGYSTYIIEELLYYIDAVFSIPERKYSEPFQLKIGNIILNTGDYAIVSGCVEKGIVGVGDVVELVETAQTYSVLSIESFHHSLISGEAGEYISIALQGDVAGIKCGQVLAQPQTMIPYYSFEAEVYFMTPEEGGRSTPIFANYEPQFYFGSTRVTGTIDLINIDMAMPGDKVEIKVNLLAPAVFEAGQKIIVREGNKTIGIGSVTRILG